jgi:hypothetical protein
VHENEPDTDQKTEPPVGEGKKRECFEKGAADEKAPCDPGMLQQPHRFRRIPRITGMEPAEIMLPLRLD